MALIENKRKELIHPCAHDTGTTRTMVINRMTERPREPFPNVLPMLSAENKANKYPL
jgi:hypothetical protein